eukprot:9487063-Pyramimonas_sp.AAC.3
MGCCQNDNIRWGPETETRSCFPGPAPPKGKADVHPHLLRVRVELRGPRPSPNLGPLIQTAAVAGRREGGRVGARGEGRRKTRREEEKGRDERGGEEGRR